MKTIIIEDENLSAQRLEGMLKTYDPGIQVLAQLPSVAESVQWLRQNEAPDLVFMDIHLEDDLCFKIFGDVFTSILVSSLSGSMPIADGISRGLGR